MTSLSLVKNTNFELDLSVISSIKNRQSRNKLQNISMESQKVITTTAKQFIAFLEEKNLNLDDSAIEKFHQLLKGKYQGATINSKMYALETLFLFQPMIKGNYKHEAAIKELFANYKNIKVDRAIKRDEYLSKEQIQNLLQIAPDQKRLIIDFLFRTGVRISEMIDIKLSDISINGKVKIKIVGKGKKEREVYITVELFNNLREIFKGKTYLFETRSAKQFNRQNLFKELKRIGKRAGFNISPHTFRHSCAMHLLNKGKSAKYVQKYLGHSDVKVTLDFYVHENPGAEVVDMFEY
jgi:integrase/recombinase XerD